MTRPPATALRLLPALLLLASCVTAAAQDTPPPDTDTTPDQHPPHPINGSSEQDEDSSKATTSTRGIVPIEDYTGDDILTRSTITGDWGGTRGEWAENGVSLEMDLTQLIQGVISDGANSSTTYSMRGDILGLFDFDRMDLVPGGLATVRFEFRLGESANSNAGTLSPVDNLSLSPVTADPTDNTAAITNLSWTQYVLPTLALFAGKLDYGNGDAVDFASGRGKSQFMNFTLVFNPVYARVVPYASLGAGVVWVPDPNVQVMSAFIGTAEGSTEIGFNLLDQGITWSTEAYFQYRLDSLPGGIMGGLAYGFSGEFDTAIGRLPNLPPVPTSSSSSWAVYANAWQYLYVVDPPTGPLNITDGRAEQGIGLFGRFGWADKNTNPVEWSLSGGVGGRGMIPGRELDQFGAGVFYMSILQTPASALAGFDDHEVGFELYYNARITPWFDLSFDLQVVDSGFRPNGTPVVLGIRAYLDF